MTIFRDMLVDDEDRDLSLVNWAINDSGYYYRAIPKLKNKNERLHRVIAQRMFGDIEGKQVDHINRNRLDNRRCNLRIATQSENGYNRMMSPTNKSGFIGVSWRKDKQKWHSRAKKDYRNLHLGYFDDVKQAAFARDAKVYELAPKFCHLNFPQSRPLYEILAWLG